MDVDKAVSLFYSLVHKGHKKWRAGTKYLAWWEASYRVHPSWYTDLSSGGFGNC